MTAERVGYEFKVFLDIKRSGFLITASRDQKIFGEKFINWICAPMLGLNRADQERIEEATDQLLKELKDDK